MISDLQIHHPAGEAHALPVGGSEERGAQNAPWDFWRLCEQVSTEEWLDAARRSLGRLSGLCLPAEIDLSVLCDAILSERLIGNGTPRLSLLRRAYYLAVRPLLSGKARLFLHRMAGKRDHRGGQLRWPVEDRYVLFLMDCLRQLQTIRNRDGFEFVHFWPQNRRFAFVLTHDVESEAGRDFVMRVADLEERYGFRSCFNLVARGYRLDPGFLTDLRSRGFEIGLHGLKHDGSLFRSRRSFLKQAEAINRYIHEWGVAGFRSPFTHRNADWMQALEIDYDSSFFDTDPFEAMPGGTMSIWPFYLGRFVELPYTLPQDHTLITRLQEKSPRLWLDKINFIERYCGLGLLNTHPDYLTDKLNFSIYEEFLRSMSGRGDYWHALPQDVARWWRTRSGYGSSKAPRSLTGTGLFKPLVKRVRIEDTELTLLPLIDPAPTTMEHHDEPTG